MRNTRPVQASAVAAQARAFPQGAEAKAATQAPIRAKELQQLRPFDAGAPDRAVFPEEPQWHRPAPGQRHHHHPDASGPPSHHHHYSAYYTGWYCHPWYRYTHWTTSVVWLGFPARPWRHWWIPPVRGGWVWVPGYWYWGAWHPGYWRPGATVPAGYVYVPGWWETNVIYVDGYYRLAEREGWRWVDGIYLEDGTYVRGHWRPVGASPEGYTWVPGFWNGETWLEGFWRPEYRGGYRWLGGYYDEDGLFVAGYWEPTVERADHVWVPGWFDGNAWVEGYWITQAEMEEEDPTTWVPEPVVEPGQPVELPADAPLALPVISEGLGEAPAPP